MRLGPRNTAVSSFVGYFSKACFGLEEERGDCPRPSSKSLMHDSKNIFSFTGLIQIPGDSSDNRVWKWNCFVHASCMKQVCFLLTADSK